MKKIYLAIMFVLIMVVTILLKPFNTNAVEISDLNDLWGETAKSYLENDYSQYKNVKVTGKYYKVGIMGHHIATEINGVTMEAYKVEDYVPSKSVGYPSETKVTTEQSYTIIDRVTASLQVKVGTCQEIEAAAKLGDIGKVGANASDAREYIFGIERMYSEELSKNFKVEDTLDYTTIPSDKKTFSVSRVSCCLVFDIASTYTEEQNIRKQWKKIASTEKTNFKVRYYIADVICYCYNDGTFGDTKMGVYKLTTMKNYE